ncbi:alpha-D-ribose 1-methylphosphonate 5-triphosphate diphosphatase [Rhodovulum sp. YNF3179]|uniref:alpha-D-ribose 1-methylphosphonate 5-triphosphate diphosphatase n=1 Tax=Rhodovulum sp. YNF3179 TaxID=3425127 RepID=UPI003D327AE6
MTETVLANARLVLPGEVVTGSLRIAGGDIAAIDTGMAVPAGALDCEGDYLAPGLIELHTDNLERHMQPRPGVKWPQKAAVIAHDAELASVGITTVFDALRVGSILSNDRSRHGKYARDLTRHILDLRSAGRLRISHFLHLRAEICSETLLEELEEFVPEDRIGILSLMDHTPGQRQFRDLSKFAEYLTGKYGMSREDIDAHFEGLYALKTRYGARHETGAVDHARRLGAVLASHDDTRSEDVETSAAHGCRLAEFPTTEEAAEACRASGIAVMMGAPNLLRGGSHSGNVGAGVLAEQGLLDILSSDYAPSALLMGAVRLGLETQDMAAGLRTVTAAPAAVAGLSDRGRIAPGLRADLVRFSLAEGLPITRAAWSRGHRVA